MIAVSDWDDLVKETYGKPYSFQQQDGCKDRGLEQISIPVECDDSDLPEIMEFEINGGECGVRFNTWLNTSVEKINEEHPETYNGRNKLWWDRNFYPDVQMIANDLYKKGLIEAGHYTIEIDW